MSASAAPPAQPKNLILMIPDGCGPATFTLARAVANRALALDSILVGSCQTAALDSRITDSAASATAYATGVGTNNGMIAMDRERRPLGTLFEAAESRGVATGIVVTCRVTHATPAAFVAHVPNRNQETEIASQMLEHGLEVLLGGGRREFVATASGGRRSDGRDLTAEAARRGVQVVGDPQALAAVTATPVYGWFADNNMDYELDRDSARQPSLAEMTRKAIQLLHGDPQGFVLLVEGSRVDHAGHDNDAANHARELLAFDEAAAVVLDFARRDGRTLVVSVADHETGGLAIGHAGEDHGGGWNPEPLRRVKASAERMARRINDGENPAQVLSSGGGVSDPDAEEIAALSLPKRWSALLAAVVAPINRRAGIGWTTLGHTGIDVGVYATGPGAEAFRGSQGNVAIGAALAQALRLDLARVTKQLRDSTSATTR